MQYELGETGSISPLAQRLLYSTSKKIKKSIINDNNIRDDMNIISKKQKSSRKNIYFCFIDYAKAFGCVDHNKLWKILKEMGIPDHLTCLLRNLYAGPEATVRTGHGTTDWFQIGKGVRQGVYCHPAYLTSIQSASCETLGWKKHKLESRLLGEISITSDMQMTPPLWQKVKRN